MIDFQQLGDNIGRRVSTIKNYDLDFPPIAHDALSKFSPETPIDHNFMINWVIDHQLPEYTALSNTFGQPALTVYVGEYFFIEVLFWFPSRTSIHGHGFCGAFRVLQGISIQTRYQFSDIKLYDDAALKTGKLELQAIDILRPGDTYKISPLESFIHAVIHLGQPSLTLVVRTTGLSQPARQYEYFKSGIAYHNEHQQQNTELQLQTLLTKHRLGENTEFKRLLERYCTIGDTHRRFCTILRMCKMPDKELREQCLNIALKGLDEKLAKRLENTLTEHQQREIFWNEFNQAADVNQYIDIGLSELIGGQEQLNGYLLKFYPDTPPDILLREWREILVSEMTNGNRAEVNTAMPEIRTTQTKKNTSKPNQFALQGYLKVKQSLSNEIALLLSNTLLIADSQNLLAKDPDVDGASYLYSYPVFESVLLQLMPKIEALTGLKLCPSYSYARVYREGQELKQHLDRPSCEISATLTLNYKSDYLWPIFVESNGQKIPVELDVGDLMIYRGCDVTHWRERFTSEVWMQVFLHYIDKNGPYYPEYAFDKRTENIPRDYKDLMLSI